MAASSEASVPRYAGAAFVAQFATSLAAGLLSLSVLSGEVGDVIAAADAEAARLRVVVILKLLTSIGIIALTSLLYVALRDTVRWVATIACALWLAEATVLAVSVLGLDALLDLGGRSAGSGSAASVSDAAVGTFALGLEQHAGDIAMLFFSFGALLWYPLFVRTRFVPRWLGSWGLVSVVPVFAATLLHVWNRDLQLSTLLYAAYVPYEFVVGSWLLVKGSPLRPVATSARAEPLPPTERPAPGQAHVHAGRRTP